MKRLVLAVLSSLTVACRPATPGPASLTLNADACGYCRMVIADARFAAQVVAPYEEPRFFDDLGCLRNYLERRSTRPSGERVFVADHHTGAWIPADRAIYIRAKGVAAAMGSHVLAYAATTSMEADPAAKGSASLDLRDVFGASLPKGDRP